MSRSAERAGLDPATRFLLVDRDLDEHESKIAVLRTDHESDIAAVSGRLDKILWALIGMVISLGTAALLLALNLAVR